MKTPGDGKITFFYEISHRASDLEGSCEQDNAHLVFIKDDEYLDYLSVLSASQDEI
jgi:hypothetical protein